MLDALPKNVGVGNVLWEISWITGTSLQSAFADATTKTNVMAVSSATGTIFSSLITNVQISKSLAGTPMILRVRRLGSSVSDTYPNPVYLLLVVIRSVSAATSSD